MSHGVAYTYVAQSSARGRHVPIADIGDSSSSHDRVICTEHVMESKVLSFRTLFALVAHLCAFSTAHAQETCSAEVSPISAWRATGARGSIFGDQGTTYDEVADIFEARNINI